MLRLYVLHLILDAGSQEDYPEELNLVRRIQGPNAKFTRANYIQMCLLSP
jgi:hypothetical protein